jgi:hypothetical protein
MSGGAAQGQHIAYNQAVRTLIVLAVVGGCGSHTSPGPRQDRVAPAGAVKPATPGAAPAPPAAPPAPPPVALAASPRIDLDANRARWHIADRGLVLHLAGEGLRKYDLAYRSPWRATATVDGRRARVAAGKATLTFPWLDDDGAAELVLRARGPGKGDISAYCSVSSPTTSSPLFHVVSLGWATLGRGRMTWASTP